MKIRSDLDSRESLEHVEVAIHTPKGTWPTEGFILVPAAQRLGLQLQHAAASLNLTDADSWVATADGRELDPAASYHANGLTKRVFIRYQPPETP
jgi:hypothetical protein